MVDQITNQLEVIIDPPEIAPNLQQIGDKISFLNDLFRFEHKGQVNQFTTKDIILQQYYVDIDAHWIQLEERKERVQKYKDALEKKNGKNVKSNRWSKEKNDKYQWS